ncbi:MULTISPECIES: PspA/IM30 family protein [unclassified Mesorhizobium]|uniref:PspA/IM30 family protein n=1 Tax=unclassified Mesorhizobium TaxID=325217 RepID=UPI000F7595BA|nr:MULTISPECIES: PspA/IM30 family protein [unclassified Mesorhizobium]AZO09388.1 PspA/IM30 family protein [Mesorhizobium sp. M3A.F.Ca.ET.080.04.2.1]RWB68012.1 MAG: PspA/IM30 family protein [Mesorhizobium sp.]RWB87770.1 MAG: PspA/IM30 family protein [Mesorhizobium sp.]RWE36210.1 MAG: PspA/IM30 family protein [Mesorhizobium sp.]RWF18465.1 MAG: PspA/IM30 family protein [Mesorhizobium sp.]
MLKQFFALVRGRSHEAAEAVVDRNALVILRQQIRDCAEAIAAARRAVAIAIAQNDQEVQQHKKLVDRIEDLEKRTVAALEQEQNELACEAAETIALLEAERTASEDAQKNFGTEIERLKRIVRASEMRLRDLQRGQRIAAAADKTQRLRETAPGSTLSALQDAEETLSRLRARQKQIDAAAAAMAEMEQTGDPAAMSEKLAAAGCGAPLRNSADVVLERLAKRVSRPA